MKKTCFKCSRRMDVERFYKHPRMLDGRLGKCIDCTKTDVKEWRAQNKEYYSAYRRSRGRLPSVLSARRKYQKSLAGKASHSKALEKYAANNPLKIEARKQVRLALVRGDLKRKPCVKCGELKVHAHHEDYKKPLSVIWLCKWCHADRHLEMKLLRINP